MHIQISARVFVDDLLPYTFSARMQTSYITEYGLHTTEHGLHIAE